MIDDEAAVVVKVVRRYEPTAKPENGHDINVGDVGGKSLGGEC